MAKRQLPISPMKISGKITSIPVSKIKLGHKTIVNWQDAIVAFLDILGFSRKRSLRTNRSWFRFCM